MRSTATLAGLALLATGLAGAQDFNDTVLLADGTRDAKVSVVSEDFQEVVYKLAGGTEKKVAAEEVVDIEYGKAPGSFRSGYELWRKGRFESAAGALRSVSGTMGPTSGANLLEAYSNFYLGDSKLAMGGATNCQSAASAFERVLSDTEGAQSRFALRARAGLGNALLGAGDVPGARAAFEELGADPRLGSLSEKAASRYRVETQLGLADVLVAEGKVSDAQFACQNAQSAAPAAGPSYDSLVRLRIAEILVATNQAATVQSQYEGAARAGSADGVEVSGEDGRNAAVALAAVGLARIGAGDLLKARGELARVSVFFYEHETCHAASLYYSGVLYRKLASRYAGEAEAMGDGDEKGRKESQAETAAQMSGRYFKTLLDRHPRSQWARRYRAGDLG